MFEHDRSQTSFLLRTASFALLGGLWVTRGHFPALVLQRNVDAVSFFLLIRSVTPDRHTRSGLFTSLVVVAVCCLLLLLTLLSMLLFCFLMA
jgi:hypothetical protein